MSTDTQPADNARSSDFDLDAYFLRIGYSGSREPTLDLLRTVVQRHTQMIAFENLNPWLGWPVYLDSASLQHKLVHKGRGGYCYEQNGLFSHVMQALGFPVRHLAARVVWNQAADAATPRSHMLLCVTVDAQPYIVDVGFGGMTPTGALRLETDVVQATPHEPFRLIRAGEEFRLDAYVRGTWMSLYRFDLQEQLPADYEMASWYQSHYPQSRFIASLIAARPGLDCRYALHNTQLSIYQRSGEMEQHGLTSVSALRDALRQIFLLALPDDPALDLALQRLLAQPGV